MPTIIEQFVATLGLDNKPYKKAMREVDKDSKETKDSVVKSAQAMSSAVSGVARELVGLLLVVRGIKGVVSTLADINQETWRLGINAKNLGIAANELRDWQNAAELAGGTSEEVTKTIAGMQQALFNLHFKGQLSDQLVMLMRLGVQFQDAAGKMKPFKSILMDTAKAIERSHMDRASAYQFLQSAGFDQGSINLILGGTKALEKAYAEQQRMRQINDKNTRAAEQLAQAWIRLKQNLVAVTTQLLTAASPAIEHLFGVVNKGVQWLSDHEDSVIKVIDRIVEWLTDPNIDAAKGGFQNLTTVINGLAAAIRGLGNAWEGAKDPIDFFFKRDKTGDVVKDYDPKMSASANRKALLPALNEAEDRYGLPRGLLANVAQAESGFKATVISGQEKSKKGAVGLMQMMPQFFPEAGRSVYGDIENSGAYLQQLKDQFGSWELAVAAYNMGPKALTDALAAAKKNGAKTLKLPAETQKYLDAIFHNTSNGFVYGQSLTASTAASPGARGSIAAPTAIGATGNTTNVQIDQITVNTKATDANGMAAGVTGALTRKLSTSNIGSGMN